MRAARRYAITPGDRVPRRLGPSIALLPAMPPIFAFLHVLSSIDRTYVRSSFGCYEAPSYGGAQAVLNHGIVTAREVPDEAGVRLTLHTSGSEGEAEREIRLDVVEAPQSGDEVLEEAPVFLEPEAATVLDDKLLDADLSGERVRFAVRPRA